MTDKNNIVIIRNNPLPRYRLVLLSIFVAGLYIDWGLLFSILPPFYPSEAEKKGATPSQYGFVFGITHLMAFIFAPLFAKYGARIGPKLLVNVGGFAQGIGGICFGFLDLISNTSAFLALSYLLRAIDGICDAASWGAVLSILMKMYPDKVATIMSWTELMFGLGYAIGPAVGSWLYSVGGFTLPFLVVGCFGVILQIGLTLTLPHVAFDEKDSSSPVDDSQNSKKILTLKDMARIPSFFLPYLDDIVCFLGYTFVESMLEPHLRKTGGSQFQISLTFLLVGFLYMVVTPIAGYLCDRFKMPVLLSISGNIFMAVALFLIGPAPFLTLEPSPTLIITCGVIIGFAYAQTMVSTFSRAYGSAMRLNYADDINTYLLISGMWSATFYFGSFVGSTMAGILVEYIGFRSTSMVFFAFYLVMTVVDIGELYYSLKRIKAGRKGYDEL